MNIHAQSIGSWGGMAPPRTPYHAEMTDSAPIINLSSLLRGQGDTSARGELSELRYEQGGEEQILTFAGPAPYSLNVNTLGGNDLWLSGKFEPVLLQECARCLRPVETPLKLKLGVLLRYSPAVEEPHLEEAESGEEVLLFGEPQLDLSAFLAEVTLIEAPLSVLHDPSCKGLCQVCGTDLNEHTCEHAARVPVEQDAPHATSTPFAALRGLDLPDE